MRPLPAVFAFIALVLIASIQACLAKDYGTAILIFALASTVTLAPSVDNTIGSAWSKNGFSGSYSSALSDGSDTTYGSVSSTNGDATTTIQLNLSALPGNVATITAVQYSIRCLTSSTKSGGNIEVSVGNNVSVTALGSEVGFTPTTSFSTITNSATLNDSSVAHWSAGGASAPYIWIRGPGDGQGHTIKVAEASVILTVTLSSARQQTLTLLGVGT